jgi:hypothetical protein
MESFESFLRSQRRALLVAPLIAAAGCTDAQIAKVGALGSGHKITLYSGGQAVREFHTDGKVVSEEKSDGYYFMDRATGKLVEVSGDVVIEQE